MKMLKLLKINLLTYFNFYKLLNAKNGKEKLKEMLKFLFMVFIYFVIGIYIFIFAKMVLNSYISLKIEYVLLGEFFAISSIFSLFATIFKVEGILYNTKDYDNLISMPIKKTTIIGSKMLNLYISNLIFIFIIMLSTLLAYIRVVEVTNAFYLLFILSIFIIPLIPTIIAVIIGSVITTFASRFKIKKIVYFISMLALVIGSFYLSFQIDNTTELQLANLGENMVDTFNKIYPLTKVYLNMLLNRDLESIILFISIPILLYLLTTLIIGLYYTNIVSKINEKTFKRTYELKKVKKQSLMKALLTKEFKRYITSPTYILNSSMGLIIILCVSIGLLFISPEKIGAILGIEGMTELLVSRGPMLISVMLMLSSTSCSSISLEGKSLWIIKSLPIDTKKIFWGKILLNILLIMLPATIASASISYVLKLGIRGFILFLLNSLIYSFFISIFGLVINLHFPLLEWKSEIKVIKQSLSTFITTFGGMILGIIPLTIKTSMNPTMYILLIDGIVFLLAIILYIYLMTIGKKLFSKILA